MISKERHQCVNPIIIDMSGIDELTVMYFECREERMKCCRRCECIRNGYVFIYRIKRRRNYVAISEKSQKMA